MTALVAVAFTLVAIAGTAVALTADPQRQAVTLSVFGLSLTLLFFTLQAPDVALSQLVIGAGVVPLVVMLTIRAMRRAELVRGDDE